MLILFYFDPIYNYVAACIIAYLRAAMCITTRFLSSLIITIIVSQFDFLMLLSALLPSIFFGNLPQTQHQLE